LKWIIEPIFCTDYIMFYIMAGAGFVFLLRIWQKLNKIESRLKEMRSIFDWIAEIDY